MQRSGWLAVIGILLASAGLAACQGAGDESQGAPAQGLEREMTPRDMSGDEARRPQQGGMPAADVKRTTD
ncbi:MAG: hypothetical protein ACQETK_08290 [Pseudomonadota bacterium]